MGKGIENISLIEIADFSGIIACVFLSIVFWGLTKEKSWVFFCVIISGFFSLINRLLLLSGKPFNIRSHILAPFLTITVFFIFYYSLKKESDKGK